MGIVLRKKSNVFKTVIFLIVLFSMSFSQSSNVIINFRDSTEQREGNGDAETDATHKELSSQVPINDTTPPTITFIQPYLTNELVVIKSYYIFINITDDNPPLQGDVIIQVSNQSTLLFNASMILTGISLWSFNWNNLTSYPNQENYTLKVWAKDSSPNGNSEWSDEFSIFVSIKNSPGILQMIIYLIFVGLIFAGFMVYLNKKVLYKSVKKKGERTKGIFND